ncbi:hypothetical protein C0Z22_04660 [Halobacteriovorax sp. DA5]|nr:hypothetical protein C0Z22_04660 [Halobacteriovorax sp. DA5]
MFLSFFRFFLNYLFKAKTRQRLLIMALASLIISSFSLLSVQSVLKGLQTNRIERGKQTLGRYIIDLPKDLSFEKTQAYLDDKNLKYSFEYEIEGLIRLEGYLAPVIFHGVTSETSTILPKAIDHWPAREEILLSPYLGRKIYAGLDDKIQFISPAHTDVFFGELPRFKSLMIENFTDSMDPDIDELHAWGHAYSAFSIAKSRRYNKLRVYSVLGAAEVGELKQYLTSKGASFKTWEQLNQNLVYALALENNVVLFLFLATIVLVTFSIISGLSIFYARVRNDFASFWILGMSMDQIKKYGGLNIAIITVCAIALGNLLSFIVLKLLAQFSPVIMPAMFVDRSLPVRFTASSFVFSFLVPVIITVIFTLFSNWRFFKDNGNFISFVKKVGT